ncbi:MAG: YkgJ family cysteine cluster protein [Candidatus Omnitrophica bacterium]|nr:YkgJ family cysteine cluster protein [Candidatus Omnitrophota bacterium]
MAELSPFFLKQFVPSQVCLKCEGCCRFQAADSIWRPKWDKKEFTDDNDYVTTIVDCGRHLCRFFNKSDSTCRVYADRPFECVLYPFLLSRHVEGIKAYVHLACPYVQDHHSSAAFNEYVEYLRAFFTQPRTLDFLRGNSRLIHDYAPVENELRYLFTFVL